jgi:hypothetical protein
MALIATLVALVLGLMIATAKGTYDAQSAVVRQLSANVLLLDRILAEYGPEAEHPRDLLHQGAELMPQRLWPEDGSAPVSLAPGEARAPMDVFLREVTRLSPQNETQAFLKTQALRMTSDLAQARFQMYVQGTSPHFSRRVGGNAGLGRLIAAESAMEVGRVDFGAART